MEEYVSFNINSPFLKAVTVCVLSVALCIKEWHFITISLTCFGSKPAVTATMTCGWILESWINVCWFSDN